METGFDSRTQRLGDPVICTQLYFCGGAGDEQIEKIMKRGFSKEGITKDFTMRQFLSPFDFGCSFWLLSRFMLAR